MIITATQKYTRQTARKVRYVTDVIKKMSVEDALKQLAVMERRASLVVLKTLRQAVANAMNNHQLTLADLHIKNILIDEAPTYKRWRAVSRGRAHTILKRSCHIKVELATKDEGKPVEPIEKKVKSVEKRAQVVEKKVKPAVKKMTKKAEQKAIKKTAAVKKTSKKIIKKDKK